MKTILLCLLTLMCIAVSASDEKQEPSSVHQGSESHLEQVKPNREHVRISRTDKNTEIPVSLINKIKDDFLAHQKKINPDSDIPLADFLNRTLRRYLSIEVDISSKSKLLARPLFFEIPKGGGVIDFQEFLPNTPGKFLLQVRLKKNKEEISAFNDVKVYFVSNSVQRKIDKDTFGNGCGTYFDVTTFFQTSLSANGLEFFTKDQRYLSFLAGTFVFTLVDKNEINIATLSFEDSRFSKLQCRRV